MRIQTEISRIKLPQTSSIVSQLLDDIFANAMKRWKNRMLNSFLHCSSFFGAVSLKKCRIFLFNIPFR